MCKCNFEKKPENISQYVKGFYYIPPLGNAGITLKSTVLFSV